MKTKSLCSKLVAIAIASVWATNVHAQIDNWRAYTQKGINVFEAPKDKTSTFEKTYVRVGGSFAQQFQSLDHENDTSMSGLGLYDLAPGFNLATANLNIDVQMAPGIRMALENYMSSRHHTEFWVKGGYIQIDQLPMFGNPQWFTDMFRVKIGHFQPNYGDQQFRRTDNGNAMYNPFVGNYIMDAFTTEQGAEVYAFPTEGVMVMLGMTNGLINGGVAEAVDGKERKPSLYLKAAYDKQINDDLRTRLAVSFVNNANSGRNTLYGGDRTGSRFYGVMVPPGAALGESPNFTSGRWNPGFTNQLTATQINAFLKFKGLEFFGTFETASGNNLVKNKENKWEFADSNARSVNQLGAELLYRFLENEQMYVGGKYNMLSGELSGAFKENGSFMESSISRIEVGAGWFPIENLLLKFIYVQQKYNDVPNTSIYYGGMFSGAMIEAVASF
ncbi:MAG: hypothetical protein H6606_06205 [Flavobacteriales bacterium]|nr:hypothetical protein [Flavobacteriales bacterium]